MKSAFLTILLFFGLGMAMAQSPLEQRVSFYCEDLPLEDALFQLIDQTQINLIFSNGIIPNKLVNLSVDRMSVGWILHRLLYGTKIEYELVEDQVVLVCKPEKHKYAVTISGFIEDKETGERLIAATIQDRKSGKGTVSNEYGFFSLTLESGAVDVVFSYLGYKSEGLSKQLTENTRLNIELKPSVMLTEVLVVAHDSIPLASRNSAGLHNLSIQDVKRLPKLAGEPDLIRTLHLLPGVQTGADGVGGIYVRGGNLDQNLVLIDGVPVYNISHAAGVFSIFDPNAIKTAKLIKGGFPARYGGRLSSVLDIRMKEGNTKELKGGAEFGLLTAQFYAEGPLSKDKSSFFISGRRSHFGWYLRPFSRQLKEERGEQGNTDYSFYDLNAKLNYTLSNTDRIYLSLYRGSDFYDDGGSQSTRIPVVDIQKGDTVTFRYDQAYQEGLDWGNTVGSFRWNHLFSERLFANTTITYSNLGVSSSYLVLDSLVVDETSTPALLKRLNFGQFRSSIEDIGGRLDFELIPSYKHYFRFGVHVTHHNFSPGLLNYDESISDAVDGSLLGNERIRSTEFAVYVEDEFEIDDKWFFNVGLRASNFLVGQKHYRTLQPRLSAYWQVKPQFGLKASFDRMAQNLHLLSNSSLGLPTDLWVSSTANIEPQVSWQTALGFDVNLGKSWKLSMEGYYKEMDNLVTYSEGANLFNDWENNVTVGSGTSYGVELLLQKQYGKTTGWLSLTASRTDRQFAMVNLGRAFPFKFDRQFGGQVAFNHRFNNWLEFNLTGVFSTGSAITLPESVFYNTDPDTQSGSQFNPIQIINYESRNNTRLPYYHRIDLGVNFYFKNGGLDQTLHLGVYNLYNRNNPLYYDLRSTLVNGKTGVVEQLETVEVVLLPILPSFRYSLKF